MSEAQGQTVTIYSDGVCRKVARVAARLVVSAVLMTMIAGLAIAIMWSNDAPPPLRLFWLADFAFCVALLAVSALMVVLCTPELE